MLAFLKNLFDRPARPAGSVLAGKAPVEPTASGDPQDPRSDRSRHGSRGKISSRRSLAKITAKSLAFGDESSKYGRFEARADDGFRRMLGCGPTLNVDGTPMVGDTGFDELGKPYGVTEDFG